MYIYIGFMAVAVAAAALAAALAAPLATSQQNLLITKKPYILLSKP